MHQNTRQEHNHLLYVRKFTKSKHLENLMHHMIGCVIRSIKYSNNLQLIHVNNQVLKPNYPIFCKCTARIEYRATWLILQEKGNGSTKALSLILLSKQIKSKMKTKN